MEGVTGVRITYLLGFVRDKTDLVKYLKGNVRYLEGELHERMTWRNGDGQRQPAPPGDIGSCQV